MAGKDSRVGTPQGSVTTPGVRGTPFVGLLLIGALLLSAGCTSTYKQSPLVTPDARLQTGARIAVALPANGSYGGREYAGSGQSTADAVRSAFSKYSREARIVAECRNVDCLMKTAGSSADYLIVPEILQWEDRATEWSGIKDKLEVKIAVFSAATGAEVASSVLAGKSKWATFGGDHPQDLLPEPINQYVETLFQP